MRMIRMAVAVAALCSALLVIPAPPAQALTQGVTTFACTAACTVTGTITSTVPVRSVYPFYLFQCITPALGSYSMSQEIHPTRVAPVVAGVYNYTWTATARTPDRCIGIAELTVFFASDNFLLDTRVAPFDTQL